MRTVLLYKFQYDISLLVVWLVKHGLRKSELDLLCKMFHFEYFTTNSDKHDFNIR